MIIDEFDAHTFAENVDTKQHVEEDDETAINKSCEENVQPSVDIAPNVPVGTVDEGNEANMPYSEVTLCDVLTSSHIDWSSYYTDEELRVIEVVLRHFHWQCLEKPAVVLSS
jgi:hypothetical protein